MIKLDKVNSYEKLFLPDIAWFEYNNGCACLMSHILYIVGPQPKEIRHLE